MRHSGQGSGETGVSWVATEGFFMQRRVLYLGHVIGFCIQLTTKSKPSAMRHLQRMSLSYVLFHKTQSGIEGKEKQEAFQAAKEVVSVLYIVCVC